MPNELTDYEGFIEEILKAERCAIDRYKDHLTYELVEGLLEDEIDDEETWESFLEQYKKRKK